MKTEIKLPIYRRNKCHLYKIYSPEKCIQLCTLENHHRIDEVSTELAYNDETTKTCSEKEFQDKFQEITAKFTFIAYT